MCAITNAPTGAPQDHINAPPAPKHGKPRKPLGTNDANARILDLCEQVHIWNSKVEEQAVCEGAY